MKTTVTISRHVSATISFFFLFLFSTNSALASIDGVWTNEKIYTQGLTQVVIKSGETQIKSFAQCHPNDCDWGFNNLVKKGPNSWESVYNQRNATRILRISVTKSQELLVHLISKFNNGQPETREHYYFTKKTPNRVKIAGMWENAKPNSELTEVFVLSNHKKIRIWANCSVGGTWNFTELVNIKNNSWKAFYSQGNVDRDIKIATTKTGQLILTMKTIYKDGRKPTLSYNYFKRP